MRSVARETRPMRQLATAASTRTAATSTAKARCRRVEIRRLFMECASEGLPVVVVGAGARAGRGRLRGGGTLERGTVHDSRVGGGARQGRGVLRAQGGLLLVAAQVEAVHRRHQ